MRFGFSADFDCCCDVFVNNIMGIMEQADKRTDINNFCPICGYPLGNYNPWGVDRKKTTYDICPCCGVEWGNEDYTQKSLTEYRNAWLATDWRMVQGTVQQIKAEHSLSHTAAKEKQGDETVIGYCIEKQKSTVHK